SLAFQLSQRLRKLVEQGILTTAPVSDGSAYQEYALTKKGRGIFPILVALRQWTEEFDASVDEIATILVDRDRGRRVRKLALYAQDGREPVCRSELQPFRVTSGCAFNYFVCSP